MSCHFTKDEETSGDVMIEIGSDAGREGFHQRHSSLSSRTEEERKTALVHAYIRYIRERLRERLLGDEDASEHL